MIAPNDARLIVTLPSDREIRLTRTFDAPRELVFEAFSKPEHVGQWWGPRNTSMIVCDMDFRPGGTYRFVHGNPDGSEDAFRGEYREIVRPERIVWTFEYEGFPGHVSVETMVFEALDGKTRITGTTVFDSVEDRDGMLQSGMEQGATETYDRLAEYLEKLG
jgi:uncharacterized protein YndB with AHSA1/START domain